MVTKFTPGQIKELTELIIEKATARHFTDEQLFKLLQLPRPSEEAAAFWQGKLHPDHTYGKAVSVTPPEEAYSHGAYMDAVMGSRSVPADVKVRLLRQANDAAKVQSGRGKTLAHAALKDYPQLSFCMLRAILNSREEPAVIQGMLDDLGVKPAEIMKAAKRVVDADDHAAVAQQLANHQPKKGWFR